MFTRARLRLVIWNVSVVALLLLVIGGAVYGFFASNIYHEVDQLLIERQSRLLDAMQVDAQENQPIDPVTLYSGFGLSAQSGGSSALGSMDEPEYPTIIVDARGNYEFSTMCFLFVSTYSSGGCPADTQTPYSLDGVKAAENGATDVRTVWRNGEPERVLTFVPPVPRGYSTEVVQIAHSASGEENALTQLRTLLVIGGALGVLFAGVSGLFLANLSLVPIRHAFVRQRQFTADASHELRTPLAIIRANAEMLGRSHGLDEADGELADEIINETDHLNRLVGDLLTLARADTGALQIVHKPVDLRALVEQVHEDVRLIAAERDITSSVSLNGAVSVSGDEGRLRQLLLILLDNAMKYTDAGGRIDIELRRADNRAHLVVSDTGIGIPRDDLPHIFDRFYRVDRAREHESGGTGLGLSIANWIVQAHHGSIRPDSTIGAGTTFTVDLPVLSGRSLSAPSRREQRKAKSA
jgi:two-component system, OmpR family, sensor histidine kinase CiaH